MSKKLIAVLIGTIALTGFGISTLANGAISSYKTQQLTLNNGSKTQMNWLNFITYLPPDCNVVGF
jgi:hypothetical protein